MNHHRGKSFAHKNLTEKIPIDSIIGLLKVDLKKQTLLLLNSELMGNLVERKGPLV
jgi:hypothetical protein